MKLQIISKHETLSEAVEAAKLDFSYNPQVAKDSIRNSERASSQGWKSGEAFVTNDGVYYVHHCDIKVLNKFEPFHSCLTSDQFRVAVIGESEIEISDLVRIPKSKEGRKMIAKAGFIVA